MSDIRADLNIKIDGPSLPIGEIAKALARSAAGLKSAYPQNELWQIIETHSRCRYTVQNPLGRKLSKVQAVGPAADRLKVDQVVIVGYYDRSRQKPYIKALGGFASWDSPGVSILDWVHSLSVPGLTRVAGRASAYPNFTGLETLWSFSGERPLLLARYLHTTLGACLVAVYIKSGSIRADIYAPDGSALSSQTVASVSEGSDTGDFSRNHQGAIFPSTNQLQIIPQFEQVDLSKSIHLKKLIESESTSSCSSSRQWFCASFFKDSTIRGDYRKVQSLSQSSTYPTSPDTISFSDSGEQREIELYKAGALFASISLSSLNGSSRVVSVPVSHETNTAWAISPEKNRASIFVGLGIGLSSQDSQDVALAYGFASASSINPSGTGTCAPGNYNGLFRSLEAWVAWVNLTTGDLTSLRIEATSHESPATDSNLTGAWETYVEANPSGGFPAPGGGTTYTWGGRANPRSVQTSLFNNTLSFYEDSANPDYAESARPIGLPLANRVAEDDPNTDLREIFAWDPPSETQAGTVESGSVTYVSWLHPYSYLGAGSVGGVNSITIRNEAGDTTVMGVPFYDFLYYYSPKNWRHWKRKLVAIRDGAIFATADLTQYLKLHLVNPNTSGDLESSESYGLADNVWAILPVGRVVFVLLDKRYNGDARRESVPFLRVLRASDLSLLSEVSIYPDEELSEDVLSDPEDPESEVLFTAGTLRWNCYTGPRLMEIRGAVNSSDIREWAIIGMETQDRQNSMAVTHRLVRIDMDPNDETQEPSVNAFSWSPESEDPCPFPIQEEWDSVVIADDRVTFVRDSGSGMDVIAAT